MILGPGRGSVITGNESTLTKMTGLKNMDDGTPQFVFNSVPFYSYSANSQ